MSQTTTTPESLVRGMQIITLAMVAGAIMFAVVAILIGALSQPSTGQILSLIGALLTFGQAGLAIVAPDFMARQALTRQQQMATEVRPYSAYMTRHIIRLALLEGAAFFNIVVTIIEHNWWSLGIAGLLVGWMLTQFPTRGRVETWIAKQGSGNSE